MEEKGADQEKIQQQIAALEANAKQWLSSEAITRYGTLKSAHPQKALQAMVIIAQLAQQNQLKAKLTDAEFKQLLQQLEPQKRQTQIRR